MDDPRFSFESTISDEEAEEQLNSGLKLKPSRNRLAQKKVQQDFQKRVMETHKRLEGNLKSAYELGKEFNQLMNDTRLAQNIGPMEQSFENEIVRKLVNYAIAVNGDEQEKEGMGSVSLITLLLKTMFKMRNKLNQLSYDNHNLERRINQLEKSILSSQAKATNDGK